jgi:hypothetical protein
MISKDFLSRGSRPFRNRQDLEMMIDLKGCGFALRARVLSFIADN